MHSPFFDGRPKIEDGQLLLVHAVRPCSTFNEVTYHCLHTIGESLLLFKLQPKVRSNLKDSTIECWLFDQGSGGRKSFLVQGGWDRSKKHYLLTRLLRLSSQVSLRLVEPPSGTATLS